MKLRNEVIHFNLFSDEEIMYVAPRNGSSFWWFFLCYSLGLLLSITSAAFIMLQGHFKTQFLLFGIAVIFGFIFGLFLYTYIIDYFFTEVVLTNHRLIIMRQKKLFLLSKDEIEHISSVTSPRCPDFALIKIKNKSLKIHFINGDCLNAERFMAHYSDNEDVEESQHKFLINIFVVVFILLLVFVYVLR